MIDALKMVVVVVLLVLSLVLFPAMRTADKVEENAYEVARGAVHEFVDRVRSKGYVEPYDYNLFMNRLEGSGKVFDVRLEHYMKTYQPSYLDPSDYVTFQGTYATIYNGTFTDQILDVVYPDTPSPEYDISRRYNMNIGDLFNVRITSKGESMDSLITRIIHKSEGVPINITYGGMIRDEAP